MILLFTTFNIKVLILDSLEFSNCIVILADYDDNGSWWFTPLKNQYMGISIQYLYNLLSQSMFGHINCFGQLYISKCDASRGLKMFAHYDLFTWKMLKCVKTRSARIKVPENHRTLMSSLWSLQTQYILLLGAHRGDC